MKYSFLDKNERPWPNRRLKKGAIVGHTTTTTTRLWFRTGEHGDYSLYVYEKPDGEKTPEKDNEFFKSLAYRPYDITKLPDSIQANLLDPISFSIDNWENDSIHVTDVKGLKPGKTYMYALFNSSEKRFLIGHDRPHSFCTFPENDKKYSFGLYSCHMPYKESFFGGLGLSNIEMWDFFLAALRRHRDKGDLRFVIGGGDQAYSDGVKKLSIWKYLDKTMKRDKHGELVPSEEEMLSWYRDIFRGYWGFNSVKQVFSSFPMYMMWDDHEMGDGWGSYFMDGTVEKLEDILPSLGEKGLSYDEGIEFINRMGHAGKKAYYEYEHSHNPDTKGGPADEDDGTPEQPNGIWDYSFYHDKHSAFYFLDGRGHRNINRSSYRISGKAQMERFKTWLNSEETKSKRFLFVLAAVPVFHLRQTIANVDTGLFKNIGGLGDDLRDSWEHDLHEDETDEFCDLLFAASKRGQKVCILSGDVHLAAAYKLKRGPGEIIYQLTSSAITYNTTLLMGWLLGKTAIPETGETDKGIEFERLAFWTQSNFSIVTVLPDDDNNDNDKVEFRLYTNQSVKPRTGRGEDFADGEIPMTHSLPKVVLDFK